MDWKEKKVLVVGSGKSGISASKLLEEAGASVYILDGNESLHKSELDAKLGGNSKVKIILGELSKEIRKELDLVILSPGVPTDLPLVLKLKEEKLPIWGEIELAYLCSKGDVLAITGTNGKTTTTALLGQIMREAYKEVFVVGNIGIPYTDVAKDTTKNSKIVAEISSFQLETTHSFHPRVSAILNITPDHLNRHHTMEEYIRVKERIIACQTVDDTCVLNFEDEILREFGESIKDKVNVLYFSSKRELEQGIYFQGNKIFYKKEERKELLCEVSQLHILGIHNYENVMAACAMAISYGVTMEKIKKAILEFTGVEHRIEFVCEKNGVTFFNDSKGTNPDAAIKGIQAMNRSTYLIGGGYDKDSSYEEWIRAFDGKVKQLVLMGETREKIAEAAKKEGFSKIVLVDTLEEAVEFCCKMADPGDAVLLSPACASWGMFANYEERGERFKELVKAWE